MTFYATWAVVLCKDRITGGGEDGGDIVVETMSGYVMQRFRLAYCLGLAASVALRGAEVVSLTAETNQSVIRIGFSVATFSDVNENDALAALKVWARVLAKERGIPTDPVPRVLSGVDSISQAVRGKRVDALALPIDEYWKLRDEMDPRVFIGGVNEGKATEEYVLLVHRESGISRLADLGGRSLATFRNSRMCLGILWLDVRLVESGFGRVAEFCQLAQVPTLSKAVLPVFFRQIDACVVTRRGFNTMNELNPQIGQRLQVLASSPEMVPGGFCFRRDYNDPTRERIIKELGEMMATPAGAQVLTLFQSELPSFLPIL
jgi:ABC-type phosphate/phosphonate transport system substrate-binding protein